MARLPRQPPSLKDQYLWYRERAADPTETPENRRLWTLLANELADRVGEPEKDDPLDIEVKYAPRRGHRYDRP